MSLFRNLKQVFLLPMSIKVPLTLLGSVDQWGVPENSIRSDSFIVSAGVGTAITFEDAIVERYNARVILLDPSPTGVKTISRKTNMRNITFLPLGLSAESGNVSFGLPDRLDEGSFKKGTGTGLSFPCVSLVDIMRDHDMTKVDLLKIDVEGFEFEIIDRILVGRIEVDQICVEIHHRGVIDIQESVGSAAMLIVRLYLCGYLIAYNKNMDFTFVHRRLLKRLNDERVA